MEKSKNSKDKERIERFKGIMKGHEKLLNAIGKL